MRCWVFIGLILIIVFSGCVTGAVIQPDYPEASPAPARATDDVDVPTSLSVVTTPPPLPTATTPSCPDATTPCPDGSTALCRNFLVKGSCTTCTPSCPSQPTTPVQTTTSPSPSPSSSSPSPTPSTSPSPTPSTPPEPSPTTTPTSPPPQLFNITFIQYDPPGSDTGKYDQEWIQITGSGSLTNYTISDNSTNLYTFPEFTSAGIVTLHSSNGEDNTTDVFWGANKFIWNNGGDVATLRAPDGTVVSVYVY